MGVIPRPTYVASYPGPHVASYPGPHVAPYPGHLTPVFVAVIKAGEVLQVTRARVRSEYEATIDGGINLTMQKSNTIYIYIYIYTQSYCQKVCRSYKRTLYKQNENSTFSNQNWH